MLKKALLTLTLFLLGCQSSKESFAPEEGKYFVKNLTPFASDIKADPEPVEKLLISSELLGQKGKIRQALVKDDLLLLNEAKGFISAYDNQLKPLWSLDLNKIFGKGNCGLFTFNKAEDKIVVACENGLVAALDKAGKKIWQTKINNPIASEISIYKGRLFLSSVKEHLYAFDLSSGEKLWVVPGFLQDSLSQIKPPKIFHYKNLVIQFLSGGFIKAFDEENGHLTWFFSPNKEEFVKGKEWLEEINCKIEEDIIYYKSNRGEVIAIKIGAEKPLWSNNYLVSANELLLVKDRILLVNDFGQLVSLSKKDGSKIWSRDLTKLFNYKGSELLMEKILQPIFYKNAFFLASKSGSLLEISTVNGALVKEAKLNLQLEEYLTNFSDKMVFSTKAGVILLTKNGL